MTSPVRTLIDLAGDVDRAQLTRHADAALAKRRTSTAMLYQRMEALRRRGRVGINLLDEVLADRPDGGLESVFERAFYEIVRSGGLPLPVTQRRATPELSEKTGGQRSVSAARTAAVSARLAKTRSGTRSARVS